MDEAPELIAYTAKRYRCPHCGKSGSSRSRMKAHMEKCFRLPASKACVTCAHDALADRGRKDENGFGLLDGICAVMGRDEGVRCVRDCASWEPKERVGRKVYDFSYCDNHTNTGA